MSVNDRTPQTAARRLLGRALVLAGTAVAGTSAALLIGQPAEAEPAAEPAQPGEVLAGSPLLSEAAALTEGAADLPAAAWDRVSPADPASFPLEGIDPLTLVPGEPVERLVTSDLDEEAAAPAPDGSDPEAAPAEALAAVPDQQPAAVAVADVRSPASEPSAPQADVPVRKSGQSVPVEPEDTSGPEFPQRNSTPPASTGCAGSTADGQQGTGLPGWYPAAPSADGALPDRRADDRDELLRGVPAPQPGATPD
ncbi:hypothetical protein EIL87_22270 [Saccharopolyspora rhizosphaerae]|uniref:Uncharacterized protein n=1 Tax=Saccharopolyspora rhizosphaerae TaxID=2492662 RepID=A0A426JKI0_9PSEU|nr:hypothetical protein [Saccharopolyspora rhizosphaerae]RRO13714.1 hypothetical protein EIL87_22270 [Saccharopolyspora rhizosphaerae]